MNLSAPFIRRPIATILLMAGLLLAGLATYPLLPVGSLPKSHPEAVVPHVDQTWWLLTKFDSALVSSADGTKVAWYQRDPQRFWSLIKRASALHARLGKDWERLSQEYKDAMPMLTSQDEWVATFEKASKG